VIVRDYCFEFRVAAAEPVVVTARLAQLLLQAGDLMLEPSDVLR